MPKPRRDYIFLTAMIRAMEVRLLSRETLSQMISCENIRAFTALLAQTVYREYIEDSGTRINIHELILSRKQEVTDFLKKYSRDEDFLVFICPESDYHNLKVLLKEKLLGGYGSAKTLDSGLIDADEMKEIFQTEQFSMLPGHMQQPLHDAVEAYFTHKQSILIDLIIDRAMYAYFLNEAESRGYTFIEGYFRLKIDTANITVFMRAGKLRDNDLIRSYLFIPGGNIPLEDFITGDSDFFSTVLRLSGKYSLTPLQSVSRDEELFPYTVERGCENIMTDFLRMARYMINGPEPAFSYYHAVDSELKIISLIYYYIRGNREMKYFRERIPEIL